MSVPLPARARALHALPWTLGLWAVGVQLNEAVAVAGALTTLLLSLVLAPSDFKARHLWPLWALIAWAILAPLVAGRPPSGTGLARLLDLATLPAAAVAVSRLPGQHLLRVGQVTAGVLLASVAVAAAQHFGRWPDAAFFEPLAWTRMGFHRVYETVPGRDDRFMAGGLLLHRLKFANVTAILCTLGVASVALRVPRWRFFAFASATGLLGVAIFPHARAALAAAVLSCGLVWVLASSNRKRALLTAGVAGVVVVGLALATPSVRARFERSLTSEGGGERGAINRAGLHAIAAHPIAGVGLGRFRPGLHLPPEAPAQAREHNGKAHNQFLTLAAEAGLPAAFLLLMQLALFAALAVRSLPRGAFLAGAVSLVVLLSLLHDPLFHAESSLALSLALGAGLGALARAPARPRREA